MANRVDIVDTDNPFVLRELDVSAKVVQMPYQGAEDLSVSGFCLGGHKVNNMLCKVGVEFAIVVLDTIGPVGPVRSHDDAIFLRRGNGEACDQVSFWKNREDKE